jgi:hypothetical protein
VTARLEPGDFGYYDAVKGVFHIDKSRTMTPVQFAAERRRRLRSPVKSTLPEMSDEEFRKTHKAWNEEPWGGGKRQP